jgi:hypothetical protein
MMLLSFVILNMDFTKTGMKRCSLDCVFINGSGQGFHIC